MWTFFICSPHWWLHEHYSAKKSILKIAYNPVLEDFSNHWEDVMVHCSGQDARQDFWWFWSHRTINQTFMTPEDPPSNPYIMKKWMQAKGTLQFKHVQHTGYWSWQVPGLLKPLSTLHHTQTRCTVYDHTTGILIIEFLVLWVLGYMQLLAELHVPGQAIIIDTCSLLQK